MNYFFWSCNGQESRPTYKCIWGCLSFERCL